MTDEQLTEFLTAAAKSLPDLFAKVNVNALADSIENALGAGTVQGLRDSIATRK